jgi:hypothetical protein
MPHRYVYRERSHSRQLSQMSGWPLWQHQLRRTCDSERLMHELPAWEVHPHGLDDCLRELRGLCRGSIPKHRRQHCLYRLLRRSLSTDAGEKQLYRLLVLSCWQVFKHHEQHHVRGVSGGPLHQRKRRFERMPAVYGRQASDRERAKLLQELRPWSVPIARRGHVVGMHQLHRRKVSGWAWCF